MTTIVTNLGALPGECVLLADEETLVPATGDVLVTSKDDPATVRVAWRIPNGIFLSYDGPALAVGDEVTLPT